MSMKDLHRAGYQNAVTVEGLEGEDAIDAVLKSVDEIEREFARAVVERSSSLVPLNITEQNAVKGFPALLADFRSVGARLKADPKSKFNDGEPMVKWFARVGEKIPGNAKLYADYLNDHTLTGMVTGFLKEFPASFKKALIFFASIPGMAISGLGGIVWGAIPWYVKAGGVLVGGFLLFKKIGLIEKKDGNTTG